METNKKTDWQQLLVINSWRLHLSLRAHINYIVAVWTFKRSDVINLFRVTVGSVWSQGFYTCGIAALRPHLQDTFCRCQWLPWGAARGKEGCGQASLSSEFLGGSSFCLHWDPRLRTLFHSSSGMNVTQRSVPSLSLPGEPWCHCSPGCPSLSFQTTIVSIPGLGKQTKRPLLCCSPRATNNGLLFPGSCRENHRYFFLFCSENVSCKLKPNIFRYLNKRVKKGIYT